MRLKILLFICIVILVGCSTDPSDRVYSEQLSDEDRQQISIVPLPYHVDLQEDSYTLSEPINWVLEGATDKVFKQAFSTTSSWFDNLRLQKSEKTWTITLSAENSAPENPHLHMDESYNLTIEEYDITLTAETGIGIERGLQTLKQLITNDNNTYTIPQSTIYDQPQYSWRGLMIDVSRHFMPLEILYQNVDAMAIAKMNVCLLYTSPSPRDRTRSRMPSSA